MRLEATSLAGWNIGCVEPVERRFDLREGDLILMVSVVFPTEEPWVEEQLAAWRGRTLPSCAGVSRKPPACAAES